MNVPPRPRVLRCPDCGAHERLLFAVQTALIVYSIKADPSEPDGIAATQRSIESPKNWQLRCNECGAEGSDDDTWTNDWWLEEGGDDE